MVNNTTLETVYICKIRRSLMAKSQSNSRVLMIARMEISIVLLVSRICVLNIDIEIEYIISDCRGWPTLCMHSGAA